MEAGRLNIRKYAFVMTAEVQGLKMQKKKSENPKVIKKNEARP